MPFAVEGQRHAVVDQRLLVEAAGQAVLAQEIHGALFEQARPHPRQHIVAAAVLQDDGVDAGPVEDVAEHQPDGPAPIMATCTRFM